MYALKGTAILCLDVILPVLLGRALFYMLHRKTDATVSGAGPGQLLFCYLLGHIGMWAVFQVYAVPMILTKQKLTTLTAVWLVTVLVIALVGLIGCRKRIARDRRDRRRQKEETFRKMKRDGWTAEQILTLVMAAAAAAVIVWQMHFYVFQMHIDEDDATWLAQALEASRTNGMLLTNGTTGRELDHISMWEWGRSRDLISPWPMLIAAKAVLTGIHSTVYAHTILPVVLLAASYGAWETVGKACFPKRPVMRAGFLLSVAVLLMFFTGSRRSLAEFSLLRIWQGKAVVAAVIVPAVLGLLWQVMRVRQQEQNALFGCLFLCDLAACLLSGMGILLAGIAIGFFGIYTAVLQKRGSVVWKSLLCCVPSIVYGGVNLMGTWFG